MGIIIDLKKKADESELQYIWRICSAKDSGALDMTWTEVAGVLNSELSLYQGEAAYRKKYQNAKAFQDDVFSKMDGGEYSAELMKQRRELERAKIAFRDERNAWQKQNYIQSRVESKLDYLGEQLSQIGRREFPMTTRASNASGDNDLLVVLSDLHIGQCFSSFFGEYNADIAKERMDKYLAKILEIAKRHHSENCYVSIQGDLISGSIHKVLAVTNRENVIEQIKIASEMIVSFCYELSKHFKNVYVSNVSGNHSRIDRKEDALHDERLDDLIGWITEKLLSDVKNIKPIACIIDNGINSFDIRGKTYVAVHGDYDSFNKQGVSNLLLMLGSIPYAVIMGHMHTCAIDECSGVKMIRSGSFSGSGDQYTIEKRLSGNPSQMVCVCTENGLDAAYIVELDKY